MVEPNFEALPVAVQKYVLSLMPPESLMRAMCSSRICTPLIRSKEFRDLYLSRSMARPQILFVYVHEASYKYEVVFKSVYQEEEPVLCQLSTHSFNKVIRPVSQPIHGVICLESIAGEIMICNPRFHRLQTIQPPIQNPQRFWRVSFFGYDKHRDVFKVLRKDLKQFHVITVGSDDAWRPITCNYDHSPFSENGLCVDGVLYYIALSSSGRKSSKRVVMSFILTSEEFKVIDIPQRFDAGCTRLVNYQGELALLQIIGSGTNQVLDICSWRETAGAGDWVSTTTEIPPWQVIAGFPEFVFLGTIGKRLLVFKTFVSTPQTSLLYYDLHTGNFTRHEIEIGLDEYIKFDTYLNHVDSTWLV